MITKKKIMLKIIVIKIMNIIVKNNNNNYIKTKIALKINRLIMKVLILPHLVHRKIKKVLVQIVKLILIKDF